MKKFLSIIAFAACAFLMYSCNDADKFEYGKEVLIMTGAESNPIIKFAVDDIPSSYFVSVSATGKAKADIEVTLAIDTSLVATYNAKNKTSYYPLPISAVELVNDKVTISEGNAFSSVAEVQVISDSEFVEGRTYLIPVTIVNADGPLDVLESGRTIYLRISRTISFYALDISTSSMYSNFIFDDDQAVDLSEGYTYEIKCFVDSWNTSISRLTQWCGPEEERSNMLRFGENGYDNNSLQWVHPAGNFVSLTRFNTKVWYLLSLTYDGTNLAMYVDGVKDTEEPGEGYTTFQRWEMGMSWTSYPSSQCFHGRICEVRVWDYARASSEIQLGLVSVDVASEGLVAYWKFNEGTGHIFNDATGHGYDMDWNNTYREMSEGAGLVATSYGSYVERSWVKDSYNVVVD